MIAHVAQVEITPRSGMGRVAWHWREAFESRGHRFVHIGPREAGEGVHPALFPFRARAAQSRLAATADAILVHEPAAFAFLGRSCPVVLFSHGLERRGWEVALRLRDEPGGAIRRRSQILFPLWRLLPCDLGVRDASAVLVLNREDLEYAQARYGRSRRRTFLVRNGVDATSLTEADQPAGPPAVLFLGSYLARKGVGTLVRAASRLAGQGVDLRWILAGTGRPREAVLRDWPRALHDRVEVLPTFDPADEGALYRRASIFTLPSFFEGQPLSLLQAMRAGRCVVASDTCGQRDLVRHGDNGLLFASGDDRALAELLERAARDAALRQRLGRRARLSVTERTWPRVADEVVDLVERCLPAGG